MPKSRKKYLLWDFDGTLAWREGGWTGALLQALKKAKIDLQLTPEQIRPYLQSGFPWHAPENAHPGISADDWWEDLYPLFVRAFRTAGVPSKDLFPLARKVRPAYLDLHAWKCFPDSIPTLEKLTASGWKHVLLTNHVPELDKLLKHLHLDTHFTATFNSAVTGYEKPNPKAFRNVLDWAGPNAEIWVIGDSYRTDIVGASEVNLPAILVRKPDPQAERYCAALDEIIDLIKK